MPTTIVRPAPERRAEYLTFAAQRRADMATFQALADEQRTNYRLLHASHPNAVFAACMCRSYEQMAEAAEFAAEELERWAADLDGVA